MNVESLVDMREMVVSQMESDRRLMVRMFLKVGQKEINLIWHISALIGMLFFSTSRWLFGLWCLGIGLYHSGLQLGSLTNWIAIWMVFNRIEPYPVQVFRNSF